MTSSPNRAVLFVDGNNWYHCLKGAGISRTGDIDLAKVAAKIVAPRTWTALRYYIGQVPNSGNTQLYADQRKYLARLTSSDPRISVHFGRLEERREKNDAAIELLQFLAGLKGKGITLDRHVYYGLYDIGQRHRETKFRVEKAVDVMLSVDLVVMAERNEYDTAYVLSADGDYTPAVEFARSRGKKVFAASAGHGAQLGAAVNAFIRIDASWLAGCY